MDVDQSNGLVPGTKFEQGSFLLYWYEKTFLNIILKIEIRQMMGKNVNLHISKMAVFVIFFTGSTILKPYYTVLIHFPVLWGYSRWRPKWLPNYLNVNITLNSRWPPNCCQIAQM